MFKKYFLPLSLFTALTALSNVGYAAAIVNGNFEAGLSDWNQLVNIEGSVRWTDGTAILSAGAGTALPTAVLFQGTEDFENFDNGIPLDTADRFLSFDAVFSELIFPDEIDSGTESDSLEVWLYDVNDAVLLETIGTTTGISSFLIDISAYSGRRVAFSFELNDSEDGKNYQVVLDNVRIVPLPSTMILIMAGGLAYVAGWLRHRKVYPGIS